MSTTFDTILEKGTIYDGTGAEGYVADIGIKGGEIAQIGDLTEAEEGERIDVARLAVTPGFIDLHVHGQDATSYDFMARDGVTTALELEAGVHGVEDFLEAREGAARIRYGASAGHIGARIYVKHGFLSGAVLADAEPGERVRLSLNDDFLGRPVRS